MAQNPSITKNDHNQPILLNIHILKSGRSVMIKKDQFKLLLYFR